MTTLNLTIVNSVDADDTSWDSVGGFNSGNGYQQAGLTGGVGYRAGIRFVSVSGLTAGVTITAADLQIRVNARINNPSTVIHKLEKQSAPAATTSAANGDAKTLTTASTSFDYVTTGAFSTISMITAVQEVVDASLDPSAIHVIMRDNGESNDYMEFSARESTFDSLFDITYTAGGSTVVKDIIGSGIIPWAR